MSIKPQAQNKTNISRIRYRSPSHLTRSSPKNTTIRKRFTSSTNKGYSPYDDTVAIKIRSTSADRNRYSATVEPGKIRHSTLRATSRMSMVLEDKEAQLEHGKILMKNRMYKDAIQSFDEILKNDKNNHDALYSRAVSYMHIKDHKNALADLTIVEKENPMYDKQLYLALSSCFVNIGDAHTALRYISKGLSKFPKFVEGYVLRGQIHYEQQL